MRTLIIVGLLVCVAIAAASAAEAGGRSGGSFHSHAYTMVFAGP